LKATQHYLEQSNGISVFSDLSIGGEGREFEGYQKFVLSKAEILGIRKSFPRNDPSPAAICPTEDIKIQAVE